MPSLIQCTYSNTCSKSSTYTNTPGLSYSVTLSKVELSELIRELRSCLDVKLQFNRAQTVLSRSLNSTRTYIFTKPTRIFMFYHIYILYTTQMAPCHALITPCLNTILPFYLSGTIFDAHPLISTIF